MGITPVTHPADPALDELVRQLGELADQLPDDPTGWPAEQLRLCGEYGVFRWFVPQALGGAGWHETDLVRGYIRLSAACLTTTFVITQRTGACSRIALAENDFPRRMLLPDLLAGRQFATVGISHLTTSRRHLSQPVLRASLDGSQVTLDGYSPWVTGALAAETLVVGATLDDGREVLLAVPRQTPGVEVARPERLVGLSASQTGAVRFERARVDRQWLLAGPVAGVLRQGTGAQTGGLQTSTLAVGLASAALGFLEAEAERRGELGEPVRALREQWRQLSDDLLLAADGRAVCSHEQLRGRANTLVLRATQAAMSAAKGAGYVARHPVGRWCREALFFLVWSCPQQVMAANLCELAGIG